MKPPEKGEIVLVHLVALEGAQEEAGTRLLAVSQVNKVGELEPVEIASWPFHETERGHYRMLGLQSTKEIELQEVHKTG